MMIALYVTLCACSKSELGGGNVRKPQKYTSSQQFLLRERPVGWLEEKGKLEDMGAAGGSPHLQVAENWQVEFTSVCFFTKGFILFVHTHFYNVRSRCG